MICRRWRYVHPTSVDVTEPHDKVPVEFVAVNTWPVDPAVDGRIYVVDDGNVGTLNDTVLATLSNKVNEWHVKLLTYDILPLSSICSTLATSFWLKLKVVQLHAIFQPPDAEVFIEILPLSIGFEGNVIFFHDGRLLQLNHS